MFISNADMTPYMARQTCRMSSQWGLIMILAVCAVALCPVSSLAVSADQPDSIPDLSTRILPEAKIHPDRVSQSGWLWNREKKVTNNGTSFFRQTFFLSAAPKSVRFNIAFDDGGAVYLNGRRVPYQSSEKIVPEKSVLPVLAKGRNVLAISVKNGSGPSGVIYFVDITLADGSKVYVHSDESVKAVSDAQPGWFQPEFDDSAWVSALFQTDVMGYPWRVASWVTYELLHRFMTAEESERYEVDERKGCELPATFDPGPKPNAKIVYKGNMPMIEVAGNLYDPDWALCAPGEPYGDSAIKKLSGLGVNFVQIPLDSGNLRKLRRF